MGMDDYRQWSFSKGRTKKCWQFTRERLTKKKTLSNPIDKNVRMKKELLCKEIYRVYSSPSGTCLIHSCTHRGWFS